MTEMSVEQEVLRLVPHGRASRAIAQILIIGVLISICVLVGTPWQQTAPVKGRVIAYAPIDRQQTIEATIDGRVVKWYVQEGSKVKAGDPIVDIMDNDPEILSRLGTEREAIRTRIQAAQLRVQAVDQRIGAMRFAQRSAVSGADQRVEMGKNRLLAAQHAIDAAEATKKAAELNYQRQTSLLDRGLASKRAVELAEADQIRAQTEVERARATLAAARTEVGALAADQGRLTNDALASISDALATRAAAESEIAAGEAELARMEVRISRQETQHVKAPSAGTIFRVIARQGGEMVKTGDTIATFVPNTSDRAVELWVHGNDVNLIHPGRRVRLQFEGWPAIQFSGWPSLAVGTYGGKVAFVDPADDGQGKFRVLVVPDKVVPWPQPENLRQGTRAGGWILLNRVSLGYELWRQFNGFPPDWTGTSNEIAANKPTKEERAE